MLSARDEARPKDSKTGEIILGHRRSTWYIPRATIADDALALNGNGISDEIEIDSCRADRRNGVRTPGHLLVTLEACHQQREQSVELLGQHRCIVSTGASAVNGTRLNAFGSTRPSAHIGTCERVVFP